MPLLTCFDDSFDLILTVAGLIGVNVCVRVSEAGVIRKTAGV